MAPRKPTILVVIEDLEPSQAISAWLREAGLRVIGCPGPQPPSYVCAGGRAESCPFAGGTDVVVLDLWLASDTVLGGTPAMQLLPYPIAWTLGSRWWPCNASAALLAPSSAAGWSWCRGRRPSVRSWGPYSADSQGRKRTPGTRPDGVCGSLERWPGDRIRA